MPPEENTPVEPVAPATEATPVAAVVEPVAASVEPVVAAPEPAIEPVAVPVEPAAPAETKPDALHTDTATLLENAGKEPTKPGDEVKPVAEVRPVEPTTPTYEFKLPEGVSLDQERLSGYTDVLGKNNVPPEAGQALLDMHIAEVQRIAERSLAEQHRVFAETRRGWVEQAMSDEQIGGAGHETAMAAVARVRDLLVPEDRREAFDDMLRVTGVGDHPEFLRAMFQGARFFNEPSAPKETALPTNAGAPPQGCGFRGVMYDHPTSRKVAGR